MNIIKPIAITTAMLISSDIPETDYAEYASGTEYAEDAYCIVAAEHKIYQSLQAANTGNTPSSSPTWWLDCGSTNRWKVFDEKVHAQSSQGESMQWVLEPGQCDSIALLNVDATSISITMTDGATGAGEPIEMSGTSEPIEMSGTSEPLEMSGGATYLYTYSDGLVSADAIIDWWTYFSLPLIAKTDFVKTDLPRISTGRITITITNSGGTAKCGEIVIGLKASIGSMKYSPSIGIIDYSTKQVDAFGNYTVLERAFSKKLSCDLTIDNDYLDYVVGLFSTYRATPLVWIGYEGLTSLMVYGFYKNFEVVIPYLTRSNCSLEVEGLI